MKIRSLTLSITLAALAGCSQMGDSGNQVLKLGQQVGGAGLSAVGGQQLLGGQRKEDDYASATPIDRLAVPPALRMPSQDMLLQQRQASIQQQRALMQRQQSLRQQPQQRSDLASAGIRPQPAPKPATTRALNNNKNYFVVVGTYPDSEQALDTFVRLSSIGLPNATMESRKARSGKTLHMVRLGPFKRQDQIDKIKDSLQADGLTQFKVVES